MRIVVFLTSYLPRWIGGTEIATDAMARSLARNGHEVDVIVAHDAGLPFYSTIDNYRVHRVGLLRIRFFGIVFFWLRSLVILRRIKPDVVHVQDIQNAPFGFLAKKLLGIPYVVWAQGSDVYLQWTFKRVMSKVVLANASVVIALTEDMKKEIQRLCQRPIRVIPNGIDAARFHQANTKNPDVITIVFVGSLRPVKGIEYLIDSMRMVTAKQSGVKLLIVGEGECKHALQQMVKNLNLQNCVEFVGHVPNDRMPDFLAECQIFALPSLSEGLPLVILESLAAGLPVVATRVGGLSEIIKDFENGFLVQPRDSVGLAERIVLLVQNRELRDAISENNRRIAASFSWSGIVRELEAVYMQALDSETRRISMSVVG